MLRSILFHSSPISWDVSHFGPVSALSRCCWVNTLSKYLNYPFSLNKQTSCISRSSSRYPLLLICFRSSRCLTYTLNTRQQHNWHGIKSIRLPAIDFCFTISAQESERSSIREMNDTTGFFISGNKDRIKGNHISKASIIYYLLNGMLCHSLRLNNRSLSNLYADRGSYGAYDAKPDNYLMTLRSAKYVVGNFTLLEKAYISMHSLTELAHHPADSFLLIENSFQTIRQHALHIFRPRLVTQHRMPVPYDTSCLQHHNQTHSSQQCYESCYSSYFIREYEAYPSDLAQFIQVNKKLLRTMSATDLLQNERMKIWCQMRCRNDCHQVHYNGREQCLRVLLQKGKASDASFAVKTPEQEIVIRFSAQVSFRDLMSVILNGASFFFIFCPVTLLLSRRFMSFFNKSDRQRSGSQVSRKAVAEQLKEYERRGIQIAWA